MENFSPGHSRQTLLHTDGNRATGRAIPDFGSLGCAHIHDPVSWTCGIGKEGMKKTSHMEIRNCDIGLVGPSLPPLPGAWRVSLSLFLPRQKCPSQTRLIKTPFPSSWIRLAVPGGAFYPVPTELLRGSVFPILCRCTRERFPHSPRAHSSRGGKINLYELEQPLLEVPALGPARELILDLLFSKHQTLLLFRYLEFGPKVLTDFWLADPLWRAPLSWCCLKQL